MRRREARSAQAPLEPTAEDVGQKRRGGHAPDEYGDIPDIRAVAWPDLFVIVIKIVDHSPCILLWARLVRSCTRPPGRALPTGFRQRSSTRIADESSNQGAQSRWRWTFRACRDTPNAICSSETTARCFLFAARLYSGFIQLSISQRISGVFKYVYNQARCAKHAW